MEIVQVHVGIQFAHWYNLVFLVFLVYMIMDGTHIYILVTDEAFFVAYFMISGDKH